MLDGFSLCIPEGARICLFGASGCGKTTVLRIIAGLQAADGGEVSTVKPNALSAVFQEDRLLPWYSALKNVEIVSDSKTARDILSKTGLIEEDIHRLPSALSGGMCRRTALARALAVGADVLLLDEPFKGLDSAIRAKIIALILQLQSEGKFKAIVFTTHSKEEIALMQAQTVLM